jgi:hypothetical protein
MDEFDNDPDHLKSIIKNLNQKLEVRIIHKIIKYFSGLIFQLTRAYNISLLLIIYRLKFKKTTKLSYGSSKRKI